MWRGGESSQKLIGGINGGGLSGAILKVYLYIVMVNRTDPLIFRRTCRHTIFTVGEPQTSML